MTQPLEYTDKKDPLEIVVDFLEKANYDSLASDVIDVFAKASTGIEQINLIAKLYLDVRNIDKAEEYALKVLKMAQRPEEKYNIRSNLAKMYNNINEPAKSLFYSKQNLAITPDNPDTNLEMVFSYYLLNQKEESERLLLKLKEKEHLLSDRHRNIVNFNMGTYNLQKGNFIEGLKGFMFGAKNLEIWFSPRELPYRHWTGGVYPGRTLIMFMEGGGIGDEFITVRFMDDLKKLGFDPVYYSTRPEIAEVFNRCGYRSVTTLDGLPKDSMWTYAMQVPIYLKSTPESVKRSNYLYASDKHREKWSFLKDRTKLKIGVRWQGNAKNERDLHRKVPLADIMKTLNDTFDPDEVEYYSLQIGDGVEALANYPEIIDLTDKIESYEDTLAMLENLDLVVTSCTSVLHAAAIVGTKTMGLVPISAYFTWVSPSTNNTSIWYEDNLRIFHQQTPKKWDEPMAEVKDYLQKVFPDNLKH